MQRGHAFSGVFFRQGMDAPYPLAQSHDPTTAKSWVVWNGTEDQTHDQPELAYLTLTETGFPIPRGKRCFGTPIRTL